MRFDRYKLKSGYYFTAFYGKPIMYDVERVPALPLVPSAYRDASYATWLAAECERITHVFIDGEMIPVLPDDSNEIRLNFNSA